MQGPRSALKKSDYVNKSTITFTLRVLDDGVITEEVLEEILTYGSLHGFGAERGLGHGRYIFNMERLTPEEKKKGTRVATPEPQPAPAPVSTTTKSRRTTRHHTPRFQLPAKTKEFKA